MSLSVVDKKKDVVIYINKILERHSDINHPLTHQEILNYLESDFDVLVERRTVGRGLEHLKRCGVDIVSSKRGSYLRERLFEDSEIRILIDGVLSSKYINKTQSIDLIKKLESLTSEYFDAKIDQVKLLDDVIKSDNSSLFYNIDIITEAIKNKKQVRFSFFKYGTDKKLYQCKNHQVTPLQMILHNQRYYLVAINEKYQNISFFRIDHIKNIAYCKTKDALDIKSIPKYEDGVNYKDILASPYIFSDDAKDVVFKAQDIIIDQIVEWFGESVGIERLDKKTLECKVHASVNSMEIWCMQYLNYVEVVEPLDLRERIRKNLSSALRKYKS